MHENTRLTKTINEGNTTLHDQRVNWLSLIMGIDVHETFDFSKRTFWAKKQNIAIPNLNS